MNKLKHIKIGLLLGAALLIGYAVTPPSKASTGAKNGTITQDSRFATAPVPATYSAPLVMLAQAAPVPTADAAPAATVSAPTPPSKWIGMITVFVPLVIAGIKFLIPKTPSAMLPILAPLLGAAAEIAMNYVGLGGGGNGTLGALLGSAGVGLREIVDQLKSATSAKPATSAKSA